MANAGANVTLSGGPGGVDAVVRLECDPLADDDPVLLYQGMEQRLRSSGGGDDSAAEIIDKAAAMKTTYVFTMATKEACDRQGRIRDGGGFDLTWFLLFPGVCGFAMLFLVAAMAVYCVVGTCVNKKKRGSGPLTELIPHRELWTSLPGLWKDGALLLGELLCGICMRRSSGKYKDIDMA